MAEAVNYSCPNCGGKLVFSAEKQLFYCEWCTSEFTQADMEEINSESVFAQDNAALQSFENEANLYICDSCGAEIIADENTAATFCYYCHSPVALKGRLSGEYCPEKIIPFGKTREEAQAKFKEWVGKKWFVPADFKSQSNIEKITGMYVPFWTAKCTARGSMRANGERTHSTKRGDTTTTHHDVYLIERNVCMRLDGVPADASRKIDDHLMDTIEPFDYSAAKNFSMSYLQGFYADKYDVSKEEITPRIKKRVDKFVKDTLMSSTVGYSSVVSLEQNSDMNITGWQYMMLPVWFLNYRHGGKDYPFAMNGQTGKFVGELPLSVPRVILGAVITALIFGGMGGVLFAMLG